MVAAEAALTVVAEAVVFMAAAEAAAFTAAVVAVGSMEAAVALIAVAAALIVAVEWRTAGAAALRPEVGPTAAGHMAAAMHREVERPRGDHLAEVRPGADSAAGARAERRARITRLPTDSGIRSAVGRGPERDRRVRPAEDSAILPERRAVPVIRWRTAVGIHLALAAVV